MVRRRRLPVGLQHHVLDPGRAVRRLRAADGRLRRAQHGARLPVATDVPDAVARAERTRALPGGRHTGPHLAAGRRLGAARPVRRDLRVGPVAPVHAVAQRWQLRSDRPLLRPRHRLLRLRSRLAALPRRLGDGLRRRRAADGRAGPLPLRRHPAADPARPAHRCGAGPPLGPPRPVRARQGGRLLARPVRPGDRLGGPDHRDDLHRAERRAARQEHPDVHRGDLCGAVLPERVAAHLDAALGRAGAAGAERGADRHDLADDRAAVPGQPERGRP